MDALSTGLACAWISQEGKIAPPEAGFIYGLTSGLVKNSAVVVLQCYLSKNLLDLNFTRQPLSEKSLLRYEWVYVLAYAILRSYAAGAAGCYASKWCGYKITLKDALKMEAFLIPLFILRKNQNVFNLMLLGSTV